MCALAGSVVWQPTQALMIGVRYFTVPSACAIAVGSIRQRNFIGAFLVAFETVSPIAGKANPAEIHRHGLRCGTTINNKRLAQVSARMDSMHEPFVVYVFRRHRPVGGFSFVGVGMVGVVTHDTELGIVSLLAMELQLHVANVAIFGFNGLAPGHGFPDR